MGLFGKKKKETAACGCAGGCNAPAVDTSRGVFVLGGGCAKCNELEASVRAALAELGYTNIYEFGGINTWPYETES